MAIKSIGSIGGVLLGCDPELFLSQEVGKVRKRTVIVPSEAIIPVDGLGNIARDGIQLEMHPAPETCRANLSNELTRMFQQLREKVEAHPGLQVNFSQVVRLTKSNLMAIPPESRRLACVPSLNAYGRKFVRKNGDTYPYRSAAGHIHIGCQEQLKSGIVPEHAVKLLDLIVGNTCVMIDRDPNAALRRTLYGRAGEYRLPKHGIEYRTLSNFWLQGYPLFSLVMALTRQTMAIAEAPRWKAYVDKIGKRDFLKPHYLDNYHYDTEEVLKLKEVDFEKVEKAINTNDLSLAKENWKQWVRPFFEQVASVEGLNWSNLPMFDYFLKVIEEKGLKEWFPEDPLTHWATKGDGHGKGWETFLDGRVWAEMDKAKETATPVAA